MKRVLFFITILFGSSFQEKQKVTGQQLFQKLYSLEGTWLMQSPNRTLLEQWEKLNDSTMKSISYQIKDNDTTALEQVELRLMGTKILYIPTVNNQMVIFKMISNSDKEFRFENRLHDYPQRIVYKLVKPDSIHAYIEGSKKGKRGRSNYYFKRIS